MSDFFERLGLPRRFSVDLAAIEREYLARSRAVHPDFHQLGSAAEQRTSLEETAALNEAYLTLKDPFRRAEYLLGLLGGPTAQQEKNLDQAFLMEMMEIREQIETAKASSANPDDWETLRSNLRERENEYLALIASEFDQPTANNLLLIRQSLNALKTIRSLLRDLEPI